jgi:D-Tyr-tRNAtyr deacylase
MRAVVQRVSRASVTVDGEVVGAIAAPGLVAEPLVDAFCAALRGRGVRVATGRFGAKMQVALVNDGPVTLVLDTD